MSHGYEMRPRWTEDLGGAWWEEGKEQLERSQYPQEQRCEEPLWLRGGRMTQTPQASVRQEASYPAWGSCRQTGRPCHSCCHSRTVALSEVRRRKKETLLSGHWLTVPSRRLPGSYWDSLVLCVWEGDVWLTTVLSVPDLHTVLLLRDAMDAVVRLVPIPVAVLIRRAVRPLQSALLHTGLRGLLSQTQSGLQEFSDPELLVPWRTFQWWGQVCEPF